MTLWALVAVLGAVAIATALGLAWRARTGRVHVGSGRPAERELAGIATAHGALGRRATLLQFSTELCAPCRSTARALGDLAGRRDGVAHVEIDLTDRPELAGRLGILQTPTTFVLDPRGRTRARIGGAPRLADLAGLLDDLEATRVPA
jgi:thiol-disulfide isomerase/thioredoxin